MKKIGVLSVQGDVSEHVSFMRYAAANLGVQLEVVEVKKKNGLSGLDALLFPGGESTTIGKLMVEYELFEPVRELALSGVPILGTCAGLVLLAKEGDEQVEETAQPLLGLMDMRVLRNAFGRQRESFEADLDVRVLGSKPYRGVFIRAPAIEKIWGKAESLCEFQGKIVSARQDNILVTAFHPELSGDLRFHKYFLDLM
jgi:5'-phosphate synthase pdxT subunit